MYNFANSQNNLQQVGPRLDSLPCIMGQQRSMWLTLLFKRWTLTSVNSRLPLSLVHISTSILPNVICTIFNHALSILIFRDVQVFIHNSGRICYFIANRRKVLIIVIQRKQIQTLQSAVQKTRKRVD
jgi:hypothetical protein